jgi:hypothetical protein
MVKIPDCLINVNLALKLRSLHTNVGRNDFRCPECKQTVEPHKAGGGVPAHFEHKNDNGKCKLSYRYKG